MTRSANTRPGTGVSSVARSGREGNAPIALRLAVAGTIGAVILGILVLRLWALTVIGGAEYAERADQNVIRKLPVAAPRGSILDRNGKQIVVNDRRQQVEVDLQDVPEERLEQLIVDLGRVLAPNQFEVAETTKNVRTAIENAPPGAIEPVVVDRDVEHEEIVHYLAEHNTDFPGVDVRETFVRKYVHGQAAAHLLGQVGRVSEEDLEQHPTLQPIDTIGRSGLESRYDEWLRGVNGYDAVEVDASGIRTDAVGIRGLPYKHGLNLVTTIDLDLQRVAERALREQTIAVSKTRDGRDANAGAVVTMVPKTGEVLTLASYPSYDPNVFTSGAKKDQRTVERLIDPDNKLTPMLNRAIAGQYPPASTYKVVTGLAAIDKGFVKPDQLVGCPAVLEINHHPFHNHVDENLGSMDLATALETSCDTYFYWLAVKFFNDPASPLQAWSTKFGLGQATGIDIPGEAQGLVPTPAWKDEHFKGWERTWSSGDSVNMSIGQGNLLTTPIQMTRVYAAIANGGKLTTPHLAKSVQNLDGRDEQDFPPTEPIDLQLDPKALDKTIDGLVKVNTGTNGTASAVFKSFKFATAGKSGTAERGTKQNPLSDHAWYCGFAPVEDPEIVSCAFIDGGAHGGSVAGPIVLQIFQEYFGVKGGNVQVGSSID